MAVRVLLADDHTMFVDGIESILSEESEIDVVGKCFEFFFLCNFFLRFY